MKRTPNMQAFVDGMSKSLFGISNSEAQVGQVCVACKRDANHFRDALNAKEYSISGLCQECQDEIFGKGEEDAND